MIFAAIMLIFWAASVVLGTLIGAAKGAGCLGFVLSVLFGPLGCLIMLVFPSQGRRDDKPVDVGSCAVPALALVVVLSVCMIALVKNGREHVAAEAASRPAAPTPMPVLTFDDELKASKLAAVAKFPAIGVKGSALNLAFLARLQVWQASRDPRLRDPHWPERLADDLAAHP